MTDGAIAAILFDFDGVLVDSEPVRFRAGAEALAGLGIHLGWDDFRSHWLGRTDAAALRDLLGTRFDADGPWVIARRNALYAARLSEVPFYGDAIALLRRLPRPARLAVASGSRRDEVTRLLGREGLVDRFAAIITAEDYNRAKPDPDPFLTAARRLAVAAEACLVIEDSQAGVASGLHAGMRVFGVDRGRGGDVSAATWCRKSLDALDVAEDGRLSVAALE